MKLKRARKLVSSKAYTERFRNMKSLVVLFVLLGGFPLFAGITVPKDVFTANELMKAQKAAKKEKTSIAFIYHNPGTG